ncbi:MAG TPA: glutathione S-transferase [Xanthobacteraceae bacterium]|nr:glutathione S-transferase [Xanthobacteraceae bacterium]
MPIIVHHLNNSRSQRVLWLLEEINAPYEIKYYQRTKAGLAPEELKAVHPLGKSPVVVADGHVLAETGAIIEYLIDHQSDGRLRPPAETEARLRYNFWMHYAEGSAMPPLLMKLIFQTMPRRSPTLLRPLVRQIAAKALTGFVDPQLSLHLGYWEQTLGQSAWFAGEDFSAADIMMSFPVEAAAARSGALGGRPKLAGFLQRIHARAAYQRALARGGPYELLR